MPRRPSRGWKHALAWRLPTAIHAALRSKVMVITGGPGVGKTKAGGQGKLIKISRSGIVAVTFLSPTDLSPTETGRAPALLRCIRRIILCRLMLRRRRENPLCGVFSARGFFVSEFVDVFLSHLEITQCQANFILLTSICAVWRLSF